jgi:hypothetical protein
MRPCFNKTKKAKEKRKKEGCIFFSSCFGIALSRQRVGYEQVFSLVLLLRMGRITVKGVGSGAK